MKPVYLLIVVMALNTTYLNNCIAVCAGVEIVAEGELQKPTCDNPLELAIVQNAINEGCAELIYSFTDNDVEYININIDCDGNGIIYNCNEDKICTYNSNQSLSNNCNLSISAIENNAPARNNIIWSKGCNLETKGKIEPYYYLCDSFFDCAAFVAVLDDETIIVSSDFIFDFFLELNYEEVNFTYTQSANLIFEGNSVYPILPLSYVICTEPLDECNYCYKDAYEPVCGRDGNTYDNACFAECNGARVEREGKCECATTPTVGEFNCD